MSAYVFDPPGPVSIPVKGETARYPLKRIFCVGRNYAAHAAEMGFEADREAPFYFTKNPSAAVMSGAEIPFPLETENYHHEMELAVAIGDHAFRVPPSEAESAIYGYACSLDMTRRDLQIAAREKSRPWDIGKDVENSAVFAPIARAGEFGALSEIGSKHIRLEVNGETRQSATLEELIWKVDEIIAHLSRYYHLEPGDIIMTGTPAGVGPVNPGDHITGGIDGLDDISLTIGEPE